MKNKDKIKELEDRIDWIQMMTDYMTKAEWDRIDELRAEIKKLKEEENE